MDTLVKHDLLEVRFDEARSFSQDELARYQSDGGMILRQLFTADDYQGVRSEMSQRLAKLETRHGLAPAEDDDIRSLSRRLLALEQAAPETQSILYDAMNGAPAMHRFATEPRLLAALQGLLSPTLSIHERHIILMSLPKREWHLATWHQDWFYNEGPFSTITVYAPLQATDAHNGSLLLALGEHQRGFIEHGEHDHGVKSKWHSLPPAAVDGFERVVSTSLDVGDVLVFNSLVPHAPRLNQSDDIRFVINLRYRDLSDTAFLEQGWRTGTIDRARRALARKEEKAQT